MGCSCRTFREEPFAASLLRKRSPHNNILRASPTREANLVRWREILRSSSCAPISLRRSMIPVSERICRCARVMSSCAVIGDTRAREWSEYRNLTTAHAMEPDGLAGDPQRELACDPYRELDSLRIADDNENEWLRLRSTGLHRGIPASAWVYGRPAGRHGPGWLRNRAERARACWRSANRRDPSAYH